MEDIMWGRRTGDRLREQWKRATQGQRDGLPSILSVCPNAGCTHGVVDHEGDGDGPYACEVDGCACGASPAPVAELSLDSGTGQPSDLESRWRQAFSEWRRRGGPTPLVELDAAMYGTAFEWHKPDGSVVRIPPAEMRVIVK